MAKRLQMFPVIKVQQQRITAWHSVRRFSSSARVGHLNIGKYRQYSSSITRAGAQITVGVVDVFDHETRVVYLAAHRT